MGQLNLITDERLKRDWQREGQCDDIGLLWQSSNVMEFRRDQHPHVFLSVTTSAHLCHFFVRCQLAFTLQKMRCRLLRNVQNLPDRLLSCMQFGDSASTVRT